MQARLPVCCEWAGQVEEVLGQAVDAVRDLKVKEDHSQSQRVVAESELCRHWGGEGRRGRDRGGEGRGGEGGEGEGRRGRGG